MTSIKNEDRMKELSLYERVLLFIIVRLVRLVGKQLGKKGRMIALLVAGTEDEKKTILSLVRDE